MALIELQGGNCDGRLDEGANHEAAIGRATTQDAPNVNDVAWRAIGRTQAGMGKADDEDLALFDFAHAWSLPLVRVRTEHIIA